MGLIVNGHFAQVADFALGWFGIDFAGDDGRRLGRWPWQTAGPAAPRRPAPGEEPKVERKHEPERRPKAEGVPKVEQEAEAGPKPVPEPKPEPRPRTVRPASPKDPARGLIREPAKELDAQP